MLLATVKKLDGTKLDHGNFESEELAMQWFQKFIDNGVYGKPEYIQYNLISEEVKDENDNIIQEAVFESVQIPSEFEIEFTEIVPSEQEILNEKIKSGRDARETCEKVLDLIAGYNIERSLSIEQISQMQATLSSSEAALRAGRPSMAKVLIAAIDPDGVLVTSEMKNNALNLLANY
jgi:hypothetical protein